MDEPSPSDEIAPFEEGRHVVRVDAKRRDGHGRKATWNDAAFDGQVRGTMDSASERRDTRPRGAVESEKRKDEIRSNPIANKGCERSKGAKRWEEPDSRDKGRSVR